VAAADVFDLAVVGAGIIGLATARELLLRAPGLRLAVLEREHAVARHQTARNSGVVHAGIYYAPGSLKARLCVEGARWLYDFCADRGIAHERCGKVIVAVDAGELARLDELERRGRANGVPGLRRLDAAGLSEVEPHCRGVAALHSPATGIADFAGVASELAREVGERGGALLLGREVAAVKRRGGEVRLRDPSGGEVAARHAVFCAGLSADRLARAAGAGADPRIVPFRGRYLRLRPPARHLVRGLIYPVPDPALPFLGVHLTRHIQGDVLVGPSALLQPRADTWTWPGTWRLARRFRRAGARELLLQTSRRAFVAAAARYVPTLRVEHVDSGWAGVRAQAVGRDGTLVDDFVFSEAAGGLHVRNAPSPGATSSLAIARVIADRAATAFGLAALGSGA